MKRFGLILLLNLILGTWDSRLGSPLYAEEEALTLTTYYPAPYGAYQNLRTTQDTYLATDSGYVGIGTTEPTHELSVNGSLRLIPHTSPTVDEEGVMYYDESSHKLRYKTDTSWVQLDPYTTQQYPKWEIGTYTGWSQSIAGPVCVLGIIVQNTSSSDNTFGLMWGFGNNVSQQTSYWIALPAKSALYIPFTRPLAIPAGSTFYFKGPDIRALCVTD